MHKNILLLTGWGATCKVWGPIIPALSDGFQINCVTPSWLPDSKIVSSLNNVDGYIEELAETINEPINIVSWSMGGLLAIKLATRLPALVESICLIASVPKFVSADNQNAGIDYQWFNQFVSQYQSQPLASLNKFLALQVKNDMSARNCLRFLINSCDFANFNLTECEYGLKLLQRLDLSEELLALKCKTLFIHGSCDAVVNLQSAQYAASISNSQIALISGAGHVPHVSQPNEVANIINTYLYK